MSQMATYDDAKLILRLYEMRRETTMREARSWFVAHARFASRDEFLKAAPAGSKENDWFRQVTSYWDMAASFVTSGVLNPDLFYQSGREMLLVYVRVHKWLPEIRAANQDPTAMRNLETVAGSFIAWLNKQDPKLYEAFVKRMG